MWVPWGSRGGWMCADSWLPLSFVARAFLAGGGGSGFLGVGGLWLALGFQGVASLQAPTSGPRGPCLRFPELPVSLV